MKRLSLFLVVIVMLIALNGCSTTRNSQDPIIVRSEPYLSKISFDDIQLRKYASEITTDCLSGDKNCYVNQIYRHVVDNYRYYSDPRREELIQSPKETIELKGGDCEDLSILLASLLESIGIKTYLVLTENHAYALACGVDTEELLGYIKKDLIEEFVEQFSQETDATLEIKDDTVYVVSEESQSFVMEGGTSYYSGGDGSIVESEKALKIEYKLSSTLPLDVYFVPTEKEFNQLSEGRQFIHYPSCEKKGVLSCSDSCLLDQHGGIVLQNANWLRTASVNLETKFYAPMPADKLIYKALKENTIKYYKIGDSHCIVLDPTGGKRSYPGYDGNMEGEKTAIDPVTKEYLNLTG